MSAATSTRKRMGLTTIISSLIIVSSLVWAAYNFGILQFGVVRTYPPHYEYDTIDYWPYNNNFTGGNRNWFENVNYTDLPLDMTLPEDLLDQLDDIVFLVSPANPAQLWRTGSYDAYDGSRWTKSQPSQLPLDDDDIGPDQIITSGEATNTIYSIFFYATAGATVGAIELPTIFPEIRFIEDSFRTYSLVDDAYVEDTTSRIQSYTLETDLYGSLLFTPFIIGETGEEVLVSYDISFELQDLANVAANAREGPFPVDPMFLDLGITPTVRVENNYSQFFGVGNNVYERAMAVQVYFQSTFDLIIDQAALLDRPPVGQETTDWFLERGGGLPMDFATAYCVFMRGLGIPARIVKGYALGEQHPTADQRSIMVRHMQFWVEVFVPMAGATEGEWIQVIPTPLPDEYGGGPDIPENTPIPDIELMIWPTSGQPWEQIGDPFTLSTSLTVEGIPITSGEYLAVYDELDSIPIGSFEVGSLIDYTFPSDATIDYHIFSATWVTPYYQVTNYTSIFAVGTPSPMSSPTPTGDFVLSATHELNVSQGVDTHVAYWEDTIHVYGTMTVGGVPVNSSNYDNRNIGIYWDNTFWGNASINEYGYYELYIYVDPYDWTEMTVGQHEVWSWYLGDWDGPIPRLNEARSADNSTLAVWGRVGFDMTVLPTDVTAGASIDYDGVAYLLNGTILPMGQQVGVFFHSQANATRGLNSTGGFSWSYVVPVTQPDGTYFAYANWSSPWPYIAGNWSQYIPINVGSSGTHITINPNWDPLYVAETITFWGHLTHFVNGSGIGGRVVEIYWNNGSTFLMGSNITEADGYFEITYTILESDVGPVEFWSSFTSMEPTLASSESIHIFSEVKKWDTSLDPIYVTPDPVIILDRVDIQGNLTMPEIPWNLANEWVDFWYQNSTGVFYIGSVMTNSTGGYFFQYTIPIGQTPDQTVYIWANFTSPYINVADGESFHEPLWVEAAQTLITIQEDFSYYYVNETILLYGTLQFANGTPIAFQTVYIHWVNVTDTFVYTKTTDALGNYFMLYNCTPTQDEPGLIDVHVNWTSIFTAVDDAFSSVSPQIQLHRYYLEITMTEPSRVLYVDEQLFEIEGVLTYLGGAPPLAGETVSIQFWDGFGWSEIDTQVTNSTGGFLSPLGFVTYDEGIYYFRVQYISTDPLNNDTAAFCDITRIKYQVNLEVTLDFNPVYQNETVTIHAYLYFPHNGTPFSNGDVDIWWDNGTVGAPFYLGTITTDGTGQGDLPYSGMDWDTVRVGIEVYGIYTGTVFFGANESFHNFLTLQQWSTGIFGVNVPFAVYQLTETVVVTGTLEYDLLSVPYAGATVNLTLFGTTLAFDITDITGDFSISWMIPGSTSPGFYDLLVEFNSPFPWIASSSAPVPQIEITAPGYDWPSFNIDPPIVYLDYVLTIWGTVTWDNGTPYANSPVDFFWGDPFSTWDTIQLDVLTDGSGNFYYEYTVPTSTPEGDRQVWAYIDPAGYATSGISTDDWITWVTVTIIGVDLTGDAGPSPVYLNQDVTFSGTLQFENTTGMVGYEVEIWWDLEIIATLTITDPAGAYTYVYTVPWDMEPGVVSGFVLFRPPNVSFGTLDILTPFPDITVMELVDIFMDPEPLDNIVSRGETLIVSGELLNNGDFPVEDVTVEVLRDGIGTAYVDFTASDGSYSIAVLVPDTIDPGVYNISVRFNSFYHTMRNGPEEWFIQVFIDSIVTVNVNQMARMPGENFAVDISLHDDDGGPLDNEWVLIRLGTRNLGLVQLFTANGQRFQFTVPLDWDDGDGTFNVTVFYDPDPSTFLNPSSDITANSIHVFTDVRFTVTPDRADPGQAFTIRCIITDTSGNPIARRTVELHYNGTDDYTLGTDDTGLITHGVPAQAAGTMIRFSFTFVGFGVSNIQSITYEINIQTTGGNPLQGTDLLIAGILLVGAVVAVLAYLYIVRGMFRGTPGISRGMDIPTKLRNIKKLADAGKYGASITLAYRTFEQMCGSKMGSERAHNETAREYLDRVLQTIPLDLGTVEQFVQTYEEARFSHHEMTRERYEEAVRIFTDLYPRIDSTVLVEKE